MHAVVVKMSVSQDQWETFLTLLSANADASVREEPGCSRFDVCTDPTTPGEMLLYELYDDAAAFEAHLQTAHFKEFDATTASMITAKSVERYDRVRPAHG